MWQIIGSPNHFKEANADVSLNSDKTKCDSESIATATAATQSEVFDRSSSTLSDDEASRTTPCDQQATQGPPAAKRPTCILASILEPIFESLNDEIERDEDTRSMIRRKSIYGPNAKESHPFFDDRFIEVEGMVVLNTEWQAKEGAIREQRPRRGGRRRPRSEQKQE